MKRKVPNKYAFLVLCLMSVITIFLLIYIEEPYHFFTITNKENVVVIYPIFTASAYSDGGFYDYYKGKCNTSCLTTTIKDVSAYETSKNGIKVLEWYGFKMIDDIDVDKNPDILKNYTTVILLHNEYVTIKEFNAILNHPNVIYMYPNALYAVITFENDKINLIRGHNYPDISIRNGFNWKNDNTVIETNSECRDWNFYKVDNGYMLNCYPDNVIKRKPEILLAMNQLFK
jgi:hypothetical protein